MSSEAGPVVAAACDGACSGNPGPGGWGALLRFEDGSVREFGGRDAATTNNRMELTAALALLETLAELPRHPRLTIRTDSRYLIDGYSRWMAGWKRKGWRTASGGAVLNRDLWEALDRARLPDLPFEHVKGHSGDPDNDRCDAIAVAFSRGGRLDLGGASPTTTEQAAASPPDPSSDRAPAALQGLLSRLELADRLAKGGYALNAVELAQLVELPLARVQAKRSSWRWRDWQVTSQAEGLWRLEREGADG